MKIPENKQYVLFGGAFVLANKLQVVADKKVQGLSVKQWFLLRNLADFQPNSQPTVTQLAKETDTSRQNVTKMLETLQKQKCVLLKHNPMDRRSQIVEITEIGRVALRQTAANSTPFFTELFSGINTEECEVAAKVLIKLIENLNRMQQDME